MEIVKDMEALSARAAEMIADRIRGCNAPFRLALSGRHHAARLLSPSRPSASGALGLRGDLSRRRAFRAARSSRQQLPHDPRDLAGERHGQSARRVRLSRPMARRKPPPKPMRKFCASNMAAAGFSPDPPLFDLHAAGPGRGRPYRLAAAGPAGAGGTPALGRAGAARAAIEPRITLTYPALESSRLTLFLVGGAAKKEALARARAGDAAIPAGRLKPQGDVIWLVGPGRGGRSDAD